MDNSIKEWGVSVMLNNPGEDGLGVQPCQGDSQEFVAPERTDTEAKKTKKKANSYQKEMEVNF